MVFGEIPCIAKDDKLCPVLSAKVVFGIASPSTFKILKTTTP
jgi:hypothetical protein